MNSSATPSPDPATNVEQSIVDTLNRQQRRLHVLTIVAIALWTLAVVGSAAVLICYAIFYAPKEKKMLQDYGAAKWSQVSNHPVEPTSGSQPPTPETVAGLQHAVGVHLAMSMAVTRGVLVVAGAVLILACGTLVTLVLVIFGRRVTLRQVNHGLAQISQQLQQLQAGRSGV